MNSVDIEDSGQRVRVCTKRNCYYRELGIENNNQPASCFKIALRIPRKGI